jgi:hypothetical protein
MRVLHYQHNGVGVVLAEQQRAMGVESRVLSTAPHPFGFKEDFLLPRHSRFRRILEPLDWARYRDYDVLHNHDVTVPASAARHWSNAIVQHYHGPTVVHRVAEADVSLTSLPSVCKEIPDAIWVPLPARTSLFRPESRRPHEGIRVGYNAQTVDPTKPALIPANEVLRGIELSGGRGIRWPLEGVVNVDDMVGYYADIDIWVDRVGCDFYGFSTVEAAAMGIPIVTQIGDYEADFVPGCPFISVDRDGVEQAVLDLIRDNDRRSELGAASREFAERVHGVNVVAAACLDLYRSLLRERS